MDSVVAGLIGIDAQTTDAFITKEVTNHLFAEEPPHGLGEDLMSLNIQRGRDHGLPGKSTSIFDLLYFIKLFCHRRRGNVQSYLCPSLSC